MGSKRRRRERARQRHGQPLWIAAPGLILAALLAALFLHEWFIIGVRADAKTIASYHFGATAMVRNGWYYATPARYAAITLTEGLAALALALGFAVAAIVPSRPLLLGAYVLLGLGLIANQAFR